MFRELMNAFPSFEDILEKGEFGNGCFHYKDGDVEISISCNTNVKEKDNAEYVQLKENFEKWLDGIDDDLFTEACELLEKDFISELNDMLKVTNGDVEELVQFTNVFKSAVNEVMTKRAETAYTDYVSNCAKLKKEYEEKLQLLNTEYEKKYKFYK